jgi:hypothetical protein
MSSKWLTWNKAAGIAFLTLLASTAVWIWMSSNDIFFRPPLLQFTPYIHLLAWVPAFVICALLRPSGSPKPLILFALLLGVVSLFNLALFGPVMPYYLGDCRLVPQANSSVYYECASDYAGASDVGTINFILEGHPLSPFVSRLNVSY